MTGREPATACLACGSADAREFCPDCGQPRWRGRYGVRRVLHEAAQTLFDADSRYLRTARELTVRPGALVWDVLRGRTNPYVMPLRYLLVVAAVVTVLSLATGLTDAQRQTQQLTELGFPADVTTQSVQVHQLLQRWYNVFLVGVAPLMALATRVLFRRWKLHFAEHLVINAYVAAHQTALVLPFVPLLAWTSTVTTAVAGLLYLVVSIGYAVFGLASFFGGDRFVTGGLALVAVVLSTGVYFALVLAALSAWVDLRS